MGAQGRFQHNVKYQILKKNHKTIKTGHNSKMPHRWHPVEFQSFIEVLPKYKNITWTTQDVLHMFSFYFCRLYPRVIFLVTEFCTLCFRLICDIMSSSAMPATWSGPSSSSWRLGPSSKGSPPPPPGGLATLPGWVAMLTKFALVGHRTEKVGNYWYKRPSILG